MELVLIGYFPKRYLARPDWLAGEHIREVCSVSECMASGPEGWLEKWVHNDMWAYNSVHDAWSVALEEAEADAWRMYAYKLFPLEFSGWERRPLTIPHLPVEPLPPDFFSLGFDVVSRSQGAMFECSPLSCNRLADEVAVNQYCLASTLEQAVAVAGEFAREEPEPGPYVVLEVLRTEKPPAAA